MSTLNEVASRLGATIGKVEAKLTELANHTATRLEELQTELKQAREAARVAEPTPAPKSKIRITVKRAHPKAVLPAYAHTGPRGDLAADLYAVEDHVIKPGELYKAPTGLILQAPPGYGFRVRERSGQWFNKQLRVGAGTIDPGYTGELAVGLYNHGTEAQEIRAGERIAQLQVVDRIEGEFVDGEPEATDRGTGGFGSTGR